MIDREAVSCDFRVSATDTVFWYPEVEPGVPLTWAAPDPALHMAKTQFRGSSRQSAQNDVSEADADQIELARLRPGAKDGFRVPF